MPTVRMALAWLASQSAREKIFAVTQQDSGIAR
jgi:hypothetical protein